MTANDRIAAWDSTPLSNVIQGNPSYCKTMYERRLQLTEARDQPSVPWLKARLGPQSYCWQGEYRYWVWEVDWELTVSPPLRYRVFASNIKGWSFEVQEGVSEFQAYAMWDCFVDRLERKI